MVGGEKERKKKDGKYATKQIKIRKHEDQTRNLGIGMLVTNVRNASRK